MEILNAIPKRLIYFVLVTVFSLLIGLSQRKIHIIDHKDEKVFGTDRTFTFIGIFGYVLYLLRPADMILFLVGALILSAFLVVYYLHHLRLDRDYGITSVLIALITFCLGPLIETQSLWFAVIVVITLLVFAELKESFISLSEKMGKDEFVTLAKFLIMAGVILPIVPDTPFLEGLSLTPYRIWLAVVIVSGISYVSYLLRKFFVRDSSIIVSGILGGLYSSTATTIILAKKSRTEPGRISQYMAAIMFATSMMYLRVLILVMIFNLQLLGIAWSWLLLLSAWSFVIGLFFLFYRNRERRGVDKDLMTGSNPLEFRTALIFTVLFVLLSFLTWFVLSRFGHMGLNFLSYVVGLVDIDPFLLSLFEGKFDIGLALVLMASFQAIISNNMMKMIYGLTFGDKKSYLYLVPGFLLIIAVNLLIVILL